MVVGEQRSLVLEEMQEARNLFEIRRHIRIIATQMNIVELQIDDVLDAAAERPELAAGSWQLAALAGPTPATRSAKSAPAE